MFEYGMTQWVVGSEPLERSCRRLRDCGYELIEFAAEPYRLDADECNRLMREYGLRCRSLCGMYGEDRDLTAAEGGGVQYLKDCADFAEKVGASVVIVVPSPVGRTAPPPGMGEEELWSNAVRNIREAADHAARKNVRFVIEAINRYETYFANTLTRAWKLVRDIDHPSVGIMADLFHMSIEENDIASSLRMIREKLWHVHIADNTREPAGLGTTDFREVLLTLRDIGYSGALVMEFMYRLANPYASLEMSAQADLMDRYARQSIDYMRMVERSVNFG